MIQNDIIINSSESDKIFFSLIRSVTQVVKTFLADGTKKTAANIFQGNYFTQSVGNLRELDMYLNNLTQFDTISIGLTQHIQGELVTNKVLKRREELNNGK